MSAGSKLLFIVSGPSGAGKGTFISHVRESFPAIQHTPTYTTRSPRAGEVDGVDYNFIAADTFHEYCKDGRIAEYTRTYGDYYYGSPSALLSLDGPQLLVETDYKGMLRFRHLSPRRVVSIFILPDSFESIQHRITARHKEDNMEERLKNYYEQTQFAYCYDYVLVNRDIPQFKADIGHVLEAELLRARGVDTLLGLMHEADPTLKQ
jgi:guanylate kinase